MRQNRFNLDAAELEQNKKSRNLSLDIEKSMDIT